MNVRRAVTAALLCCALAGCVGPDGPGVASAGGAGADPGQGAAADEVSDDPVEAARQFAQCMRDNGIDMPDPEPAAEGGGAAVRIGDGADQAGLEAALKACEEYSPMAGGPDLDDPERHARMREFAQCMRDNGIEDFPDPQNGGGIVVQGGPDFGIDPDDPEFERAQQACADRLPQLGGGPETSVEGPS